MEGRTGTRRMWKIAAGIPRVSLEGGEREVYSKVSSQDGAPKFPVCVDLAPRCGIVDQFCVDWGSKTVYGEHWGVYSADRKLASERRALAAGHCSHGCFSFVYTLQDKVAGEGGVPGG